MLDDRTSAEYQQWRQDVRKRDGNSCRRCGFDTNLEVHHIKPLVKYPEFKTELDNGLTLCGNCHSLLKDREEATDLLKFIEGSPYSRDEQIVECLMVMMAEQIKALNEKFAELTRRQAEVPQENAEFTELGHFQAEMLRLEAEEKLREAARLRRKADDAVKKRQSETEQKRRRETEEKRRREEEQKRQREAEKQQRRNTEEKLGTTKQQSSIRDFQEGNSEHFSDNRASIQVKKKKNLGKPENSHGKHLKQTNKASTRQKSNTDRRRMYRRKPDRNTLKVKAAQRRQSDASDQLALGLKHELSGNDREAVKCYRKAAKQRNAAAQYNLGQMYEYGEGVFKDSRQAAKWYRKAAEQGYRAAQKKLGWLYQNGRGVPQNSAEALKWYQKATERRPPAAR